MIYEKDDAKKPALGKPEGLMLEALQRVCLYLYDDERKDCQESNWLESHIFWDVKILSNWIDYQTEDRI